MRRPWSTPPRVGYRRDLFDLLGRYQPGFRFLSSASANVSLSPLSRRDDELHGP
jgi:hypothetical protein